MGGKFITFEGIEGCGKSTQIELLQKYLQEKGQRVLLTREPGGSPIGDEIRSTLLNTKHKEMLPLTELLLYAAGRCQHIGQIIQPALKEGQIVLCDRYADSTTAYQGAARKIDIDTLQKMHQLATNNLQPDITFLLDLPVEEGIKRIQSRTLDRFEKEKKEFHEKVRQGYLDLAKREPNRIKIISAKESVEIVHQTILQEVNRLLEI